MKLFDFKSDFIELDEFPEDWCEKDEFFVLCDSKEVSTMQGALYFDMATVKDCEDLDEKVRYTSFNGYDFFSIAYFERDKDQVSHNELNLYVSKQYVVMVVSDNKGKRIDALKEHIMEVVKEARNKEDKLSKIYFAILNKVLEDFSDVMESLEDDLQELQTQILSNANKGQFEEIVSFATMTYTIKKYLRAMSFLGAQVLVDDNGLISESHKKHFRSIDTRLKKLYGFAEGLYDHVNQLISSYESKLSMKTNETVNKLTILTVFFGPLTVITGIYGMNFDFMPELHMKHGYPMAIGMMTVISILLYGVLKFKKWM